MAPWKITVIASTDDDPIELIVPANGDLTFTSFLETILKRASKLSSRTLTPSDKTQLRLNSATGYHVDNEDKIEDVLTPNDVLFVVLTHSISKPEATKSDQTHRRSLVPNSAKFQIRVITPLTAVMNDDIRQIPLLQEGRQFSDQSTLRDIKSAVCDHLDVVFDDSLAIDNNKCNCKLAEQLAERGNWERHDCTGHETNMRCNFEAAGKPLFNDICARCSNGLSAHTSVVNEDETCNAHVLVRRDLHCGHIIHSSCLENPQGDWSCPASCRSTTPPAFSLSNHSNIVVVSGDHSVRLVYIKQPNLGAVMDSLRKEFGVDFETSYSVSCKGDIEAADGSFTVFPVISICSAASHESASCNRAAKPFTASPTRIEIDIHTAECPIETTYLDQTVADVALSKLAVSGVLTLYSLCRQTRSEPSAKRIGKDVIFTSAPHWEISSAQSERGTAAFLSSLRVFTHVTGSKDFSDFQQNEVLAIIHQLTRFPPTVRAMHILLKGQSIRQNESAALVQSFNAILQDLIPLQIFENDSRRVLEGARLLFGFILSKVRKESTESKEKSVIDQESSIGSNRLPYIQGYKTIDLRDVKLSDPVSNYPVLTKFGLMDRNVFLAHENGGILGHTPSDSGKLATDPDVQILRVARLFGGMVPDVTCYDPDALASSLFRSSSSNNISKDIRNYFKDLKYVASICDETNMTVVRPRALATASTPALTLDRHGYLAVNLGFAPCSHDKLIFKPVSGAEERVDVELMEQLLEPIMRSRERDGTAVFDMFSSSYQKKTSLPSELLMFVVDCSYSMGSSSDFTGINDVQNDPVVLPSLTGDLVMDDHDASPVEFSEIKDWVFAHEFFPDMVGLVHAASSNNAMPAVAKEVMQFLRKQTSREIVRRSKDQQGLQSWASLGLLSRRSGENRIDKLRRVLTGLELHEKPLVDSIVFQARDPGYIPTEFVWHYDEPIPTEETPAELSETVNLTRDFIVPGEFQCPISQAVFEDPVKTSDLLGPFERRAIERWFRMKKSSPLTGLPLHDTTLRHDQALKDQIRRWVQGDDIIGAAPPTNKRTRGSSTSGLLINFVAPTGSFSRNLPKTLTLAALHQVIFRGMRGVYANFSVTFGGNILPASGATLATRGIPHGCELVVHSSVVNSRQIARDMCLVKVYLSDSTGQEGFSYWMPRHTPTTLLSILFRYWRVNQHNASYSNPDCDVWSGLLYKGDGTICGTKHDAWDALSTLFGRLRPKQILRTEALYEHPQSSNEFAYLEESEEDEEEYPHHVGEHRRVLKVWLHTYRSPEEDQESNLRELRTLTRMGVSKQVFGAFINRLIAYNFPTTVGLVKFGSAAVVTQKLTNVIENFRTAIEKLEVDGDSAIWDAIHLAADHLIQHRQGNPALMCRIICLSDGSDTSSKQAAHEVCRTLLQNEIVVDSCSIGQEDNSELRAISYLTGGYAFVPKTLEDAVALSSGWQAGELNRDVFPARKPHPHLEDAFVRIGTFDRPATTTPLLESSDAQGIQSGMRTRRLLTEIRDIAGNSHPSYDVYVSESNMGFWKVVVAGPEGSAYNNGTFVLYLEMGESYPRTAPQGRFITPIFHPNISRHGLICHSIFDRNWTADTTNRQVLDTVFGLLLVPEFSEPINTTVILSFYWDEVAFKDEAQKHITKFATRSREELGRQIVGG